MKRIKLLVVVTFTIFLVTTAPFSSAIEHHAAIDTFKQKIIANGFIDIALLLTILNIIIVRTLAGFPGSLRSMIYNVQVIIYILSLMQIIKQEYKTGEIQPRYKA